MACSWSHGPKYAGGGSQAVYISRSEGWRRPKKHENLVRRGIDPQEVEEGRGGIF
tara:strand:- start:178 stop:342 length:165 start_codon:yes stop_codon:yes gene_type:complete